LIELIEKSYNQSKFNTSVFQAAIVCQPYINRKEKSRKSDITKSAIRLFAPQQKQGKVTFGAVLPVIGTGQKYRRNKNRYTKKRSFHFRLFFAMPDYRRVTVTSALNASG